jgi:hypothetical protein
VIQFLNGNLGVIYSGRRAIQISLPLDQPQQNALHQMRSQLDIFNSAVASPCRAKSLEKWLQPGLLIVATMPSALSMSL